MDYERESENESEEEDIMDTELVDQKSGEILSLDEKEMGMAPMGQQVAVFGTTDLNGIVDRATQIANRLKDIVEKAQLSVMIKDKKYVKAEGWVAMTAMFGVFPSTEYCKKVERDDEIAYEARIVLRHISGNEVGAGEALCSSKERNWGGRDEFAIKSMAQTRATGKACRLSFSWIMALAGYQPTPAEEMISEMPETRPVPMPQAKKANESQVISVPVSKFFPQLHKLAREKDVSDAGMKKIIRELFQKESSKALTDDECASLIKLIESGSVK